MDEKGAGVVFWALLFASDTLRQGRRRTPTEIARDAGVPESTVRRQVRDMRIPSFYILWALAEVTGMDADLVKAVTSTRTERIILEPDAGQLQRPGAAG